MEAEQIRSPEQISDSLRITSIPTYLLAGAVIVLLGAFIVWGFLGNVSDKAYYSGVVFPVQGTTDITLPNKGMVRTMMVHLEAALTPHPHLMSGMSAIVTKTE